MVSIGLVAIILPKLMMCGRIFFDDPDFTTGVIQTDRQLERFLEITRKSKYNTTATNYYSIFNIGGVFLHYEFPS
jgi:hypothetical protein